MSGGEFAGAWTVVNSGAVLALLGYVIASERRLTKLETIIEILTKRTP
ncbi:hypothetical protein [Aquabacterium sp.]|nr:hypothetical protein [Aquabacterium sp.]